MTVLIVDDQAENLFLMGTVFQMHGYQAITTTQADKALSLAQKHRPKLILIDVFMPGDGSGIDILSRLKQMPTLKNIPVVIFTASTADQLAQRAIEAEAVEFMQVPVPLERLHNLAQRFLTSSDMQSSPKAS